MNENKSITADFDNSWKEILDHFLPWFLKLFFPDVYGEIDWNKGFESLEKELSKIAKEAAVSKRFVDKLLKVYQNSGEEKWVYIHLEVQSQQRKDVAERMYIYNSLLYLRYRKPVMSLLVLGDDKPNWRPERFEYNLWGSQVQLKFQTVKLLDYRNQVEELKRSKNPFAFFVIAHLGTLETKNIPEERLNQKEAITKEMLVKGFSRDEVFLLYKFIDILMTLPEDLEQSFIKRIDNFQEEKKMPILAPFERIAQEKGMKEGMKEGIKIGEKRGIEIGEQRGEQKGEQRGSIKEAQVTLIDILNVKFGDVPQSLDKSIKTLDDLPFLRELRKHALTINSLKEIKQLIKECKNQRGN